MKLARLSLLVLPLVASADNLTIVEATIEQLQAALSAGQTNAVQLVAKHLHRIALYDRRGPRLHSIPVLDPYVFEQAQASDDYRAQSNGSIRSILEGIPGTIKDSYKMKGLTVAAGSPAFQKLSATDDAFTTSQIRNGGGIILGKTNMPPMANGGMQLGLYGRAESPYNADYLTAAYASGSTNGGGTSTSASLAVFAMGEETISSGRSPASNNGLVAYTPSRGLISVRGNWPLFPIADVLVPMARTVKDLLGLLDVVVVEDQDTAGDFWRIQPFLKLPPVSSVRPCTSFLRLANADALRGKRVGVPKMFIGEQYQAAQPVWVSPDVRQLWKGARTTLERLGATVVEVDFPLVTNYETKPTSNLRNISYPQPGRRDHSWGDLSLHLTAYAWDDFLRMNNDSSSVSRLINVNPERIFPQLPGTLEDRYGGAWFNRTAHAADLIEIARRRNSSILDLPGINATLHLVENRRKRDLEAWMRTYSLDTVVFPSIGDVARSDSETNVTSADFAWRNGVLYSNGNDVIRESGVPTVSVTMGTMNSTSMPVSLTFVSRAYDDHSLLSYAYSFEYAHNKRIRPLRTPALETDTIAGHGHVANASSPPKLTAVAKRFHGFIHISGSVDVGTSEGLDSLEVFVDGVELAKPRLRKGRWVVSTPAPLFNGAASDMAVEIGYNPNWSSSMVVVVATAKNGRSAGKLMFV
ncbi:amidase-like protein [Beauveria bassiana ARSEF 2860]|uniref:Amidase-like protein n=1 Tax=Beauveria bassiana (strain ARSEF 2860) TaxID=655819 RepID=J5JJT0_BEAB2|nr:amidase-like protein [Beauveria bassiana ARSEF 2860]EJP63551.1 amidase-like protein [Beauveria bassiana ARSEF 2860]